MTMQEMERFFNERTDTKREQYSLIIPENDPNVKHYLYCGVRFLWIDTKLNYAVFPKTYFNPTKSIEWQRTKGAFLHFVIKQGFHVYVDGEPFTVNK